MTKTSLKLSVLDLVPAYGKTDDVTALQQAVRLAQTAEKLGYLRYWAAEHHGMPMLASSAPEVLLAHIGARTERIRLGTGALLLPHYKPLKVAETFHMLACLYPGRMDLGLGRAPGGSGPASLALSDNFIANIAKLPDTLDALVRLMNGTYSLEGEPVIARPTPKLPPELWMLGTNKKSAAYAAEYGFGYVFGQFMSEASGIEMLASYRSAFNPSAFLEEPKVIVAIGVLCVKTEAEVQQLAADAAAIYQGISPTQDEEGLPLHSRKRIAGTPSTVIEQLHELAQLYGTDEFLIQTTIPDYDQRLRSYELLAEANSEYS